MTVAQRAVSKNKRRFKDKKHKFDLDLSYIGSRIVAMGFPSENTEALYRNPFPEVKRFFETYHPNNYYIYNLCAEKDRIYDSEKFHGRVKHFPFYDHNAPPVNLILECCNDIFEWLKESKEHVVGVHCKAGKGRTGLISCCFLMLNGTCKNSDEALVYYGNKRTKDGKGVTIASQIRYIRYYERVLKELDGTIPPAIPLVLTLVRITYYPKKEIKITGDPHILIEINDQITHKSEAGIIEKVKKGGYKADIRVTGIVQGDVKIILQVKKGAKKQKLCHFWFNSGFIEDMKLELPKKEIDVANKDKNCKIFKEDFKIECFFKEPDPEDEVPNPIPEEEGEDNSKDESEEHNNNDKDDKKKKKSNKDKRKSFYDYSDYGQLQEALDFSAEEEENSKPEDDD
jgi:phosphatidylinositol-3,4,5-trisphosphate 3-phosphatase/dual-specificity protein phosphatase PTEN